MCILGVYYMFFNVGSQYDLSVRSMSMSLKKNC